MSDWTYIAGEGGYDQDFRVVNQETNELIDVAGATDSKMFIVTTDRDSVGADTTDPLKNFPVGGTTMTPDTNDKGEPVLRMAVQSNFMPQEADMYLAQIGYTLGGSFKTFVINLRVIRNLGS